MLVLLYARCPATSLKTRIDVFMSPTVRGGQPLVFLDTVLVDAYPLRREEGGHHAQETSTILS
jgi:hypothetical protein